MDDQQKTEQWEKVRLKGLGRFILKYGILKFALPSVIVTNAVLFYLDHGFDIDYLKHFLTAQCILFLIFSILISGLIFGWFVWNFIEYKYRKIKR